jgi:hypothetical protein
MDLFQVVIIGFVLVASVAVIAAFVAMVSAADRRTPKGRVPVGIAPGWYPDARDESLLRYFDGRSPTDRTSRRELEG